jgi:DedD protein
MHGLLDSDLEHGDDGPHANGEREISLGTATVLGIFFLIALVCAGCFGFGYMLGRKSNQADAAPTAVANNGSHTSKPGAGSTPSKPTAVPSDQGANTTSQPEIASPPRERRACKERGATDAGDGNGRGTSFTAAGAQEGDCQRG